MAPVVRRRTAPRSDGYGAARPDVPPAEKDWLADEQEDAAPARESAPRRQRAASNGRATGTTSGGRGWSAYKKNKVRSSRGSYGDNPDEFTVAELDVTYLIKPLDDAPLWSYAEHFVDEITEGQKRFCCGGEICPLCDLQYPLRAYAVWDIAAWVPDSRNQDGGIWAHKFWQASADPAGKIESAAELLARSRTPRVLSDVYLVVSKTAGKKKSDGRSINEFSVTSVKERDLEDDHGAYPLDDGDYEAFAENPFDPEKLFPPSSLRELRAAAKAIDDPAISDDDVPF